MPSQRELNARGGLVRVRTQRLANGGYRYVYVVREAGARGGRTLIGENHRRKDRRANRTP